MTRNVVIALLTSVVLQAHAQTQESGTVTQSRPAYQDSYARPTSAFHLIPIAGLNFMGLKGSGHSFDAEPGGTIGGLTDVGSGYVQLETGVLFNSYTSSATESIVRVEVRRDYVSVPVLGKVNLMGNPDRTVYLKAGLMPSWTTLKKVTVSALGMTSDSNDVSFTSFDLPAVIGVGGAIRMAQNKALIIEGIYMKSTSTIDSSSQDRSDVRNEGLAITCGFSFGI